MANLSGRPFGAALGLDAPQGPHKAMNENEHSSNEQLFTVKPGGIAGYLASLCGTDSYVNISAKNDCFVGFLPNEALERILERRPIVLLTLAKRLLSLLSPLVLHIDAALDWMQLSGGQVLYEKGDRSGDFYIVINGRLRSINQKDDSVEVLGEYGQGDSIGELDVITAVPRSDTVHAIRDSELVRIPAALFDAISVKHPATTVQFMRLIAGRVRRAMGEQALATGRGGPSKVTPDVNLSEWYFNYLTAMRLIGVQKPFVSLGPIGVCQLRILLENSRHHWRSSGRLHRISIKGLLFDILVDMPLHESGECLFAMRQ